MAGRVGLGTTGWFAVLGLTVAVAACGDDDPTPPPGNRSPTAVAAVSPGEIPRADGNTTVFTLDGSGSSDPDGDPLTFAWTVPGGTFEGGTDATSEVAQVSFPGTGNSDVGLNVSDGNGGTDQVTVRIALVNTPPVAVATAEPDSVPAGDGNTTVVTLDATGSSDPDGDSFTFAWTVPSGTFQSGSSATDARPEVTFPGTGDYMVTVIVTDEFEAADTASVTVFLITSP